MASAMKAIGALILATDRRIETGLPQWRQFRWYLRDR